MVALSLAAEILRNPTVPLESFWMTYLSYGLLLTLHGAGGLPFRARAAGLMATLLGTSWSSMMVLGHDTGPVMICFLAVLTTALLLPMAFTVVALLASSGVVWLSADVVPVLDPPGALSAIGFAGTTVAGLALVVYVVRILEDQLYARVRDIASLKQATLDREEAEHKLDKARESLEEAHRFEAIGRVAGGTAHEFNNLLQVISSWVEILESESDCEDSDEILGFIKSAAKEAGDITNDLLTIARRGVHDRTVVDVAALIPSISSSWRQLLPKGVTLELAVEPSGLCLVNKALLQQCILNLLRNAADPDVGSTKILLRVHPAEHDRVGIQVIDDGCGMDDERRARAFEPFFTSKVGRGNGLGLAIVRGTIEQYGGKVTLSSSPGEGTTVSISLPTTDETIEDAEVSKASVLAQSMRVLVVEDEELLLKAICKMLDRKDLSHEACADGAEAMEALRDNEFDMLCIDAHMPGPPPVDVIARFKELNPTGKVLVCSGNIRSEVLLAYIQDESIPVLTKPFTREEFYQALGDLNVSL